MIPIYKYFYFYVFLLFAAAEGSTIYDDSWALVVGINDYDAVQDLNYAVEDALAIKNMLINQFGFKRSNVRYLIDKEATQSNIKRELSNLRKKAGENDRVIFYFAGHGETEELGIDEGDIGFLLPSDADADDLYYSAIDMEELKRISKMSKAKHMLFLVDACYGGLAAVNTRALSTSSPNYIDKIKKESARQVITAGGKEEKVIEKDEWEHSAFTKNLLAGLKDNKADQNQDGYITGSEIGLYLQEKVSFDTENYQTPQSRKLTTHDGEIIFLSNSFENNSQNKSSNNQIEDLQKLVLELSSKIDQQSKGKIENIDDNPIVIKPGSIGLYSLDPTKEVRIEGIFLRPSGLAYKAKFKMNIDASEENSWGREVILDLDKVLEITGETETGIYNYNSGEVK